jgi:hypothetical protein
VSVSTEVFKVRTGPESGDFVFTSGGDYHFNIAAITIAKHAMLEEPLFGIAGGDIAYDNGMVHCYRKWDYFFTHWMTVMKTPSGYTLPILTCIGNHEASGFKQVRDNNAFYLRLFPHVTSLQGIDPQERSTNHFHRISDNTIIVVLDSWIHSSPESQVSWLDHVLDNFSSYPNKFALYHGSLYPSNVHNIADIVEESRIHWGPIFDKYRLTIALENHFHVLKISHPIYNNSIVPLGKGTLYLGDGAMGVAPLPLYPNYVHPFVKQVQSWCHLYAFQVSTHEVMTNVYSYASHKQADVMSMTQQQVQVTRFPAK